MFSQQIETCPIHLTLEAKDRALNSCLASQKMFKIGVIGGGCSGFQYQFSFVSKEQLQGSDKIFSTDHPNFFIVIHADSIPYLKGASIHYKKSLEASRFTVDNPNAMQTCSCGSSFDAIEELFLPCSK